METLVVLFNHACGHALPATETTPARRAQLALAALGAAVVMAALWGVAAGSAVPQLALANLYKLPLIVVLSVLGALPAGLLAWKLMGVERPARELLLACASSIFLGTSVLVVLAPLVALYYHSSQWAGPYVAMGSVFVALLVGSLSYLRALRPEGEGASGGLRAVIPAGVLVVAYALTLLQLVAAFSPILPEHTLFRMGIDAIAH